jgi:hypothetical protein
MIVATRRTDILRGGPIVVVVASTKFGEPLRPNEKLLPHDPDGHPKTGLKKPCVAVCDWVEKINADDVIDTGGVVPDPLLKDILLAAGITILPER